MGLFGLVLHNLEQRTKEIDLRKISGSSIMKLTVSLSKHFFLFLIIALCIGLPISYASARLPDLQRQPAD
jgi:putative ABC transport system permease protein